ncbi:hypothetical protein COW36_00145 [bacterium (Candidatus Blackallbacteria) CG17_big_fil_post_rev_8_21_14_2_50_48_46]|uniref:PIN domain-containing protein n=1 Tax=bacterium (Candidatus Blackallbacteria) CG17_big_fil_post_rev_8_21_14_2_50_48_46 TaxID=2014261 RepID=A0A2M7GBW6_9BACT|nr:MAG: hypothetical protein COW64_08065 [bacterium (Candidatus Blackallbacteria) CG18_big_fil_WC_8_21_14_2_50_49_26]PIW19630.1 MAG: hypothetical protein COW36_00145 [bacterium (Candidatus Blackallbacteria) CG17_big_fil_post_rev_8_21_14_2_50_48_46]
MKAIVLDSSSLTELKQAGLLNPFIQAKSPVILCDFVWVTCRGLFSERERKDFEKKGLITRELDGKQVERVFRLFQKNPSMTRCNCFSFVLASTIPQSVLVSNCQVVQSLAALQKQPCKSLSWARKGLKMA